MRRNLKLDPPKPGEVLVVVLVLDNTGPKASLVTFTESLMLEEPLKGCAAFVVDKMRVAVAATRAKFTQGKEV